MPACLCVCVSECVSLLAVHPSSDSLSPSHTHFHSNLGSNSSSRSPGLSLPLSLSLLAQLLLCCFAAAAAAGVRVCVCVAAAATQVHPRLSLSDVLPLTRQPSLSLSLLISRHLLSFSPLTHTLSLPSHLRVTHLLCAAPSQSLHVSVTILSKASQSSYSFKAAVSLIF